MDRMLAMVLVALTLVGAMIVASCDSGDDKGSGASGSTTIIGSVNSYVAGSSFVVPVRRASGLAVMLDRALGVLVASANAGLGGVTVSVQGTDLSTVAAEDGSFVISGVPAGVQQLVFRYGDSTAYLSIEVPENATITLSGIEIVNGSVNIGGMNVEVNDNASTLNENDNAGGDDSGNDNSATDDNANDNDPADDNANDNVPVDDNANDNVPVDDNANDNVPVDDNANDNVI
jgi:hypothetical protein